MTAHLHSLGQPVPHVPRGRQPLLGGAVRYLGESPDAITELEVEDLVAHHRRFGMRPHAIGAAGIGLIDILEDIGLTGRGGGHFPVASKWRAVRAAGSDAIVVGNGAEGEPLSSKDAALLELRPHLVLDGLALAAEALNATDAVLWLHDGADTTYATVSRALAERRAAGLVDPHIRIETGPDHYLSGESSAIVQALSGGPALPQFRRVSAAKSGVNGRPTLVQNVETLARVAVAAREPEAIAPSTMLTIAAPGHRTVLEVDPTRRLHEAVTSAVGRTVPQAALIGGYGGSWVPWEQIEDLPVHEAAARERGLSLGAGIVVPLRADECGLALTASIADYLAESSARQCGPCLFGLRAVADVLRDLADGESGRRDLPRLRRFLAEIKGRGGCHHPDGAVRMVASAVTTFSDDVHEHLKGRCLHKRAYRGRRRA